MLNIFKKIGSLLLLISLLPLHSVQAQTSESPTIACVPVQQLSQNKTQLECRMRSQETPYFLVSEVGFPFQVTRLIKVSSSFSAALGLQYPTEVVENTVFVSSIGWGDSQVDPRMQAIPFDSLSIFIETDQSMKEVKQAMETGEVTVALLTPNPADPQNPFFQTLEVEETLLFDGTLLLESFTQYVNPGILQFLQLGLACYEQSPQACLSNVIQNL